MSETEIKVSDTIMDNDPRTIENDKPRFLTVEYVGVYDVSARTKKGRLVVISSKRIHTDGKPRRSGFSLVTQEPVK